MCFDRQIVEKILVSDWTKTLRFCKCFPKTERTLTRVHPDRAAAFTASNAFPLRGAWRDHRFPEPFSWFLHETGLESLKITSARCFLLKCQRKVSKKAKEHRQFRGVLGRWRTAAIDRTTFHACQRCRKTAVFAVFSRLWGVIWRGKAFRDQQCQFLTRNKSLSSENESNCSITSECVRTDSILPRGAGLEHGRYKQSIFSLSIFGILVERLSF